MKYYIGTSERDTFVFYPLLLEPDCSPDIIITSLPPPIIFYELPNLLYRFSLPTEVELDTKLDLLLELDAIEFDAIEAVASCWELELLLKLGI